MSIEVDIPYPDSRLLLLKRIRESASEAGSRALPTLNEGVGTVTYLM